MANIGNNLIDDVRSGNMFIITCLVRRNGRLTNISSALGFIDGKYLRNVLKEQGIRCKLHKYNENDNATGFVSSRYTVITDESMK